jgi:hypothetical protein
LERTHGDQEPWRRLSSKPESARAIIKQRDSELPLSLKPERGDLVCKGRDPLFSRAEIALLGFVRDGTASVIPYTRCYPSRINSTRESR